jgi:hypothetical protein
VDLKIATASDAISSKIKCFCKVQLKIVLELLDVGGDRHDD